MGIVDIASKVMLKVIEMIVSMIVLLYVKWTPLNELFNCQRWVRIKKKNEIYLRVKEVLREIDWVVIS